MIKEAAFPRISAHCNRVGLGRDLHRLVAGRPLVLGGVTLPSDKGYAAHSDGDALCHAVIDALLGAAGLGDIGERFPDTDAAYKDARSLGLLGRVAAELRAAGGRVVNIDCVVSLERPAVLPHKAEICRNIARALGIDAERVSLKGKTGEGIGEVGRGEAVETPAVALVGKRRLAEAGRPA